MTTASSITLRVQLFAGARERAGTESLTMTLPRGATLDDLRTALIETVPGLSPLAPHLHFAKGTTYLSDDVTFDADGEIVAIPPVSGG